MPEIDGKEARTWAMLCHLSALAFYVVPFGHLLGPLLVWMLKRQQFASVDENGKESLNFELSMTIYALIISPLCCLVVGIPLLIALSIAQIVLVIMAAVKVNNGEDFQYPLTIRFLK